MKKILLSAAAAAALAFGGAASAQDLGSVLGQILGYGSPTYNNTYPNNGTVYVDQYGRQVTIDQYGRQVLVQPNANQQYGLTGYDAWGRPVYGYITGRADQDSDRDGVDDGNDRWPTDGRQW
jgi:hypothetical protein